MGVLSLIVWSLIIVISIKYIVFVMRADNRGEGGILALMALARSGKSMRYAVIVALGLFGVGAALRRRHDHAGHLGAQRHRGLETVTPRFTPMVVPITIIVLIVLFLLQRVGTARVGAMFGPVMLAWFLIIAFIALDDIGRELRVLLAIDPRHAVTFFIHNRLHGFLVLGAVFLAVTGGEALYADMGHFGAGPIRVAWFAVVFPSLPLNYFGQGAPAASHAACDRQSVFPSRRRSRRAIRSWRWPTLATVIASQAIISGAYSTDAAGRAARLRAAHADPPHPERQIGQIYVPLVNWALAAATLTAVIGFGSSGALAGAFGIAVSLLMAITTLMATFVALQWGVNPGIIAIVNGSLLALDLLFFASTSTKLLEGGWFPLLIAFVVSFLMITWRKGEQIMDTARLALRQSSQQFMAALQGNPPLRLPGTAAVLGRMAQGVPLMLTQNVRHNHVLHEHTLMVAVSIAEIPRVPGAERATVTQLGAGLTRVELRYGFMERPDVPQGLATATAQGKIALPDPDAMTYYTGHETIVALGHSPLMARWREAVFAFMHRNAQRPAAYFGIPWPQVMEIGVEFEI